MTHRCVCEQWPARCTRCTAALPHAPHATRLAACSLTACARCAGALGRQGAGGRRVDPPRLPAASMRLLSPIARRGRSPGHRHQPAFSSAPDHLGCIPRVRRGCQCNAVPPLNDLSCTANLLARRTDTTAFLLTPQASTSPRIQSLNPGAVVEECYTSHPTMRTTVMTRGRTGSSVVC